jgi:hypothetical protein
MAKSKLNPILSALPKSLQSQVIYLDQVDLYILQCDPRTLNENPKNWRVHTQRQRATFNAFKKKYGWLGFVIYNLKTSKLLDGHMRVEEAIKDKEPYVPVILKYVDEDGENEVLATLDNIGLLAKRNNEALKSLTEATKERMGKVKNAQEQKLAQLYEDLSEVSENEDSPSVLLPQSKKKIRPPKIKQEEEPEDGPEQSYEPGDGIERDVHAEIINDDVMFNGTTWLGIPELLSSELAGPDLLPSRTYVRDAYGEDAYFCVSSGPFTEGEPIGTLGFYTEDHRFNDSYSNAGVFAEYLNDLQPKCVLTPDFSTYSDWPGALRIFSLYRSRWVGRFWQELGFPIVPSIQSLGDATTTREFALETLPKHCPSLAIQCRKSDNEGLLSFIKLIISVRKPEAFLLYGGEEKQKYLHGHLPKGVKYIYLPQYTEKRRKLRARK